MIDTTATARLTEFFAEIKGLVQFADCDIIGVHTRGLMGETPLKIAVVRDDVRIVTDLLEAGANPNLPGEDDCTPLHHAASHGHCEIIRLLLSHGASTSQVDIFGDTPADVARMLNHEESYALLVSKVA
jgi:ankyrin repeat protein